MVCLVVDKETIDSVLASSSSQLDKTSSIKVLQREFDEADMRKWAPKLVCRYTGSFRISPKFLPTLDGRLDEDASYAHPGNPSYWCLVAARTTHGVLRERSRALTYDNAGGDLISMGKSSSDEESEGSDEDPGQY
jgi:hypothetical protein